MHQLKSIYDSPFKDSNSHPIHTCFPTIAINGQSKMCGLGGFFSREEKHVVYTTRQSELT